MKEEYLTLDHVAAILGYKVDTIRRWIKRGRIAAVKIGSEWRITQSELSAFIAQQKAKQEEER